MSFLNYLLPAWKRNIDVKTSANAAILSAIDRELKVAEEDAIKSKLAMSLETAAGEWLDRYGNIFGLFRKDNEDDSSFRQRIIDYVLLSRATIPAIVEAIREFLDDYESYIEIYEPYTNIFYTNKSFLNGPDHMLGHYYTFAVIDIKFTNPFPTGIIDVINEFKPAGVTVLMTYRPSAFNPLANIVELPLASSEVKKTSSLLKLMTGMNDRIRGHLKLTERSRSDEDTSGIFFTNKSHTNSLDRLTGSFAVTNPSYNLASFSKENINVDNDTTIAKVLDQTNPLPQDFYTNTGTLSNLYASTTFSEGPQEPEGDWFSNLYFTMDLGKYLNLNYLPYLREVEPSGNYTKDTYLQLAKNPTIQMFFKTTTPITKKAKYDFQMYNLSTNKWDSIDKGLTWYELRGFTTNLNSFEPYLSENGLLFTRLNLDPNRDTPTCDIYLYYFDIGFHEEVAIRPTIKTFLGEVTTDTTTEVANPNLLINLDYTLDKENLKIVNIGDNKLGSPVHEVTSTSSHEPLSFPFENRSLDENKQYTFSLYVKDMGNSEGWGTEPAIQVWDNSGAVTEEVKLLNNMNAGKWDRIKITVEGSINPVIELVAGVANESGSYQFCCPKIEEGDEATRYIPPKR